MTYKKQPWKTFQNADRNNKHSVGSMVMNLPKQKCSELDGFTAEFHQPLEKAPQAPP